MLTTEVDPWLQITDLYRDLTLVVDGKKLLYHKAVLSQHSRVVRQLLTEDTWCKCFDVIISLDNVSLASVKYVMDLIYSGAGGWADNSANAGDYKEVIKMLQIDTIVVSDLEEQDQNAELQEFLSILSGDNTSDIPVSVPSSDLLVTRSVSTKVKSYHGAGTRSRTQSVPLDNVEALRSLKEEKNNILVSDDAPPHSTYMGKKKGRKRKQDLDNDDLISNPSNVDALYSKVSGISAPKDSFDSKNTGYSTTSKFSETMGQAKIVSKPRISQDCEIIIDEDIKKETIKTDDDKFVCPYEDCQSESKNAQSIKIHLALVHYKKTIQAEFPNWKKQKCEECDRSIGQMTAYYLHMANHKKYKYMDLTPEQLKASNSKSSGIKTKDPSSNNQQFGLDKRSSSNSESQIRMVSSPFVSAGAASYTPKPKSFSPLVSSSNLTKSASFVKTSSTSKLSNNSGFTQITRSNSFVSSSSGPGYQTIRTPITKATTKSFTSTLTPAMKGPPGPSSIIRVPGPSSSSERKPDSGIMSRVMDRRMSDGFSGTGGSGMQQRGGFIKTTVINANDKDKTRATIIKDTKKQRGF